MAKIVANENIRNPGEGLCSMIDSDILKTSDHGSIIQDQDLHLKDCILTFRLQCRSMKYRGQQLIHHSGPQGYPSSRLTMSITPPHLDFSSNAYLTVYLTPSSIYLSDPSLLSTIHPALCHVGPVGVMKDVQILSVPKSDWTRNNQQDGILQALHENVGKGIQRVEVQEEPKQRARRDEL